MTTSEESLSRHYAHRETEARWYSHWMERGYFHSEPDDREPFTIVIPPPNVTGVLHMGHILNNTIQDVLIRRARMQGFNACWVPGTDHASIATEAKVVAKLREEGVSKTEIGREAFLEHAFAWKDKYGGIILDQLKKLGASCDWERTRFTMEDKLSSAVIRVFVDLYRKGHIYQGHRMTNWDPAARTALSNEEVHYEEVDSRLYYVRYALAGRDGEYITVATTRPETILGDTAICVHPDDERYAGLVGARVLVPLLGREIPVIADDYVDREFGTGALKITPAHDENDYEIGQRHKLPFIDVLNDDGTMAASATMYVGEDREKARRLIAKDLEAAGNLVKTENYRHKVGFSERTRAVIEPRLTRQWFLKMEELSRPALEHVMNDDIRFFPPRFRNLYRHWLENVRDWCISRQLWWGQRIPAWYLEDGRVIVAETAEGALEEARRLTGNAALTAAALRQDEDVVDTWFSSWLWPISVFDGFDRPEEVDYYYPTKVLVTGWDIIFFWVARMIIAGYEYRGDKPFEHVYFTGMVRDNQRRKMSKSLGNSPDALELIDEYGADAVRVGILLSAPAGNDLLFDLKYCAQGRNFANKIWNALKLIKSWEVREGDRPELSPALDWFGAKLNATIASVNASFGEYRLSEALMTLYSFTWDDFCSWLLEIVKPAYGEPIDETSYNRTVGYFGQVLQLLHPYMPFLTEEVWHLLGERDTDIIVSKYPAAGPADEALLERGVLLQSVVTAIRDIRTQQQWKQREAVQVFVKTDNEGRYAPIIPVIEKLAFAESVVFVQEAPAGALSALVGTDEVFVVAETEVDAEAEAARIREEIAYLRGFLQSVERKLSNERFVQNAPADVVDKERQKQADGLVKIRALEEQLQNLGA